MGTIRCRLRKEKQFGSSLVVLGQEVGGTKAEGTLMGKAQCHVTHLFLNSSSEYEAHVLKMTLVTTRHRTPNHRLLMLPRLQGRDGQPLSSESWGPAKVCHGFQRENSGRLTVASSSPIIFPGPQVHIETRCPCHHQKHIRDAAMPPLSGPGCSHAGCPMRGPALLVARGPRLGSANP